MNGWRVRKTRLLMWHDGCICFANVWRSLLFPPLNLYLSFSHDRGVGEDRVWQVLFDCDERRSVVIQNREQIKLTFYVNALYVSQAHLSDLATTWQPHLCREDFLLEWSRVDSNR